MSLPETEESCFSCGIIWSWRSSREQRTPSRGAGQVSEIPRELAGIQVSAPFPSGPEERETSSRRPGASVMSDFSTFRVFICLAL